MPSLEPARPPPSCSTGSSREERAQPRVWAAADPRPPPRAPGACGVQAASLVWNLRRLEPAPNRAGTDSAQPRARRPGLCSALRPANFAGGESERRSRALILAAAAGAGTAPPSHAPLRDQLVLLASCSRSQTSLASRLWTSDKGEGLGQRHIRANWHDLQNLYQRRCDSPDVSIVKRQAPSISQTPCANNICGATATFGVWERRSSGGMGSGGTDTFKRRPIAQVAVCQAAETLGGKSLDAQSAKLYR